MHGCRAGRAGVFDTRRRLEAKCVTRLQNEAGSEILRRETGIEMTKHDLVDVFRADASMIQRPDRSLDDQALDSFAFQLSKWQMRPSNDTGCHLISSNMSCLLT